MTKTKQGDKLMTTKHGILIVTTAILTAGTMALAQAQFQKVGGVTPPKELQGGEPYTPSRLEWMCLQLNARKSHDSSHNRYSIDYNFSPPNDGIVMRIRYSPKDTDRAHLNEMVATLRRAITIIATGYGWESWMTVKEEYVEW